LNLRSSPFGSDTAVAPYVAGHRTRGLWWFRVFGYGLHWKNNRLHPPLFSERNGYDHRFAVGSWRFTVLRRTRMCVTGMDESPGQREEIVTPPPVTGTGPRLTNGVQGDSSTSEKAEAA
jgi:hypothetical protein